MSNAIESARALLNKVEDILPMTVVEITNPDQDPIIARVNKVDGFPAISPHPESASMLTGHRAVFEFFVTGPRVIKDLLALIESNNAASTNTKSAEATESKPRAVNIG